jgi:hypothetical protein
VTGLGAAGAVLGVGAGIVQVTVGEQIPQWSGAKSAPVALGLLTIGLSLLAGWAAIAQRRSASVPGRAGYGLALLGPGLLCLSTVGGLWYLPALLLVSSGMLTVEHWRATGRSLVEDGFRILVSVLGGCQILMATGGSGYVLLVGAVGGLVVMVAAWFRSLSRPVLIGLLIIGTVPFAVLGWTAVVPVLLTLVAGVVAIPIVIQTGRPYRTKEHPA